jgi:hypothetical protein
MTTGNDAAYPLMGKISASAGLTKRELFAAMAMQGLLFDPVDLQMIAKLSVKAADALIQALDDNEDDLERGNVASDRGPIQ